jgi:exonuclease III
MLKCIFWNVRGMRKRGMGSYVRDLLRENKSDFICVQKTMMQDVYEKWLRKFDTSGNFL